MNTNNLYLRKVKEEDINFLYYLRNDKNSLENHFSSKEISFSEHLQWFYKSFEDEYRDIFILCNGITGTKYGQIRFDRTPLLKDECLFADIDVITSPMHRGRGAGTYLIKEGCQTLKHITNEDIIFIAKIKKGNIASIKAFEKTWFKKYREFEDYIEYRR